MALQKYCDDRVMSGYDSMLLYKTGNEAKYHLLLPLETVPAVNGSTDTFDFDLLTCPSKGQVEGKESLEQVEVDFMWHRDNITKLENLQGQVLDFMVVYKDYTARTFSGTIKVRPQEAGADVMRGIFTITPMSASTKTLLDARDLIQPTVAFTNKIPTDVVITDATNGTDIVVETNPSRTGSTVSAQMEEGETDFVVTPSPATSDSPAKVNIKPAGDLEAGKTYYGVVFVTATSSNYASWTTTIAVEYTKPSV